MMTSYNKVNGIWSHYHYPLATEILREEWGYDGLVITDWWMRRAASPEFPICGTTPTGFAPRWTC